MDYIHKYYSFFVVTVVFAISMAVLSIIRKILFSLLKRWAKKTHLVIDTLIVESFKNPSFLIIIAIAILISLEYAAVPIKLETIVIKAVNTIVIFAITLGVAGVVSAMLQQYISNANIPLAPTGLSYIIVKGLVILVGVLIILNYLGISIAPILTTLGVGGLAVALALQDTLANLFAGMQILIEGSVRVGDFVKIEEGMEGYVEDITWRTTRIRMLTNNITIIPNSKLAQSLITNFNLPNPHLMIRIPISVSYGSDPQHVEDVLLDEAKKAIDNVPQLLAEPEPMVRFMPGFGDSSLDFTLIVYVREYNDQFLVQSYLRKQIFKRFKQENIEIPFPQRVVHISKE